MPRFLRTYAPPEESKTAIVSFSKSPEMEGALIKGKSARSIYFLDKGVRRAVGGMDIMEARNFTLAQVRGRAWGGAKGLSRRALPLPAFHLHTLTHTFLPCPSPPHRGSTGYSRQ